ncbi:Pentatricopeptide repeat-containing protein [Thalictrum thalictroides]|uniref:Pentatricopeptide repeat-containing protein n=1 Tax=Thalictrum thalictroides TaxID=46969 RepID=A0A7J6WTF5_THATH|nr:Pentatricopeptide repeat-containing protein [Thalictrum thalictroides]
MDCHCGNLPHANEFLEETVAKRLKPSAQTYASLITARCREGRVEDVKMVVEGMCKQGFELDGLTYNSIITDLCKAGKMAEARSFLLEMIERKSNAQTYASLITAYRREGRVDDVKMVVEGIHNKGLKFTYNCIITYLCKAQKMAEMIEKRFAHLASNDFRYGAFIHGESKAGEMQDADRKGVDPTIVTSNVFDDCLSKLGDVKMQEKWNITEALNLYAEMSTRGIQVDSFVYNALVDGQCKAGNMEKAPGLFQEIVQKGFAATFSFNTLIDGYCKFQKLNEVKHLLGEMVHKGIQPNHVTFTPVIDYFSNAGYMEKAKMIFLEMQEKNLMPNIVTYTSLIHVYNRKGNTSEALVLFAEMKTKGISPDEVTYDVIFYAHCKEGNPMEALKLRDELMVTGMPLSNNTYEAFTAEREEYSEAWRLLDESHSVNL